MKSKIKIKYLTSFLIIFVLCLSGCESLPEDEPTMDNYARDDLFGACVHRVKSQLERARLSITYEIRANT